MHRPYFRVKTRLKIFKRQEGAYAALIVFLVLFSLTLYQALSVSRNATEDATHQFEMRVGEISDALGRRLLAYENTLQGGAALFAATTVSREDWARYVENLDLNRNYPGIQGLGFTEVVQPDERQRFVERVRAAGFPDFRLWPEGEREIYTSIIYLEPFGWRNQRAFGYDMFSDPDRRQAMSRARDTGEAIATRSLSLVQETTTDTQAGFLIYLPVYSDGLVPATLSGRRQELIGYVYSPFRMQDLMRGIFGESSLADIRLQILDDEKLIYDSGAQDSIAAPGTSTDSAADPAESTFTKTVPFEFNGQQWTLRFSSLGPIEAMAASDRGLLVLGGGTVISFLLAGLVWMLWLNRSRAGALSRAKVNLREEVSQRESLESRLDRFFSLSSDLLCSLQENGRFAEVNPACEKILGFPVEAVVGEPFIDFVHAEDRQRATNELGILMEGKVSRSTMEIRNLTESGGVRWIEWHLVTAGQERGFYASGRDVTERKQLEQELHRSAFYDKLTGMANRSLFIDRLKHVIERSQRYDESYAAMIIDIDNFKTVNDSYGHLTGDKLLGAFAQRVQQQLRPVDTCARFGGDEFIILLEEAAGRQDVSYVAERIQNALALPFVFDGLELRARSSMGIALGDNRYKSTEQVLRDADMALYEAKRLGKNRFVFFDAKMRTEQLTQTAIETELSHCLDRQELEVVYQPIVDLEDNRIVGCEALVRWEHTRLGEMSPSDFIPIAEKSGLITAIGRFVTERACEDLADWVQNTDVSRGFFVSVNLSPKEFFIGDLVERIRKLLDRTGLQGHNLRLEVTEGILIDRYQEAASILESFQAMGIQICIDDFGTGYSSLSYLQALPIDVLKLDRTLIQQIQVSAKSREIARTVLSLANALEVKSVAEGVETDIQIDAVRELGFRYAQGFGLHEPGTSADMEVLLQQVHTAVPA